MSVFERQPAEHGTRRRYQQGCRCVPCKVSNNRYQSTVRTLRAKGKLPLGSRVAAARTWKLLRQMLPEFGGEAELARCLGLHRPYLRMHPERVTVRTALRVLRLYRLTMVENPDAPHKTSPPHDAAREG